MMLRSAKQSLLLVLLLGLARVSDGFLGAAAAKAGAVRRYRIPVLRGPSTTSGSCSRAARGDVDSVSQAAAYSACSREWQQLSGLMVERRPESYGVPEEHVQQLYRATWYLQDRSTVIQRALQVAAAAHEGQKRKNGDAFILHPVETAIILAELKMDLDTVVAGLLHDTVEDTYVSLYHLEALFGSSVASIVKGDSKVSKMTVEAAELSVAEKREINHRAMLLAMGADWRVVVVKLADRLHNMRTLQYMKREKQVRIARETIEIFVPLAHRLGIQSLEYELLHLATSFLFPDEIKGLLGVEALGHWARLLFWGALDEFLTHDQVLSETDVQGQLCSHRQKWLAHSNYWSIAFAE